MWPVDSRFLQNVRNNAVTKLVEALRYKYKGLEFDSWWYHGDFSLIEITLPHYGLWVDQEYNGNEYQEFLMMVKVAGA